MEPSRQGGGKPQQGTPLPVCVCNKLSCPLFHGHQPNHELAPPPRPEPPRIPYMRATKHAKPQPPKPKTLPPHPSPSMLSRTGQRFSVVLARDPVNVLRPKPDQWQVVQTPKSTLVRFHLFSDCMITEIEADSHENALLMVRHLLGVDRPRHPHTPRALPIVLYHGGPISKSPRASVTLGIHQLSDASKVWKRPGPRPPDGWSARNILTMTKTERNRVRR